MSDPTIQTLEHTHTYTPSASPILTAPPSPRHNRIGASVNAKNQTEHTATVPDVGLTPSSPPRNPTSSGSPQQPSSAR